MLLKFPKAFAGVLVTLLFAAACGEDGPDIPVNVNLAVNPTEVTIPASGGQATVSFTSPIAWAASTSADWLRISPASGEGAEKINITLSATENQSTDQRTATVTVKVPTLNNISESVKVIQLGKEVPSLELSAESFNCAAEGGESSLTVKANVPWTAKSNANWITLSKNSGEAGTATIVLTSAPNPVYEPRTGTVVFTAESISKTVTIAQAAAQKPDVKEEISGFSATVGDWADGGNIVITTNGVVPQEWAVYLPQESTMLEMEKGADGIYRACIMGHYSVMPIFFVRGGKDIFGSVYSSEYIPTTENGASVSLIYTSSSSHAVYVPFDSNIDVALDPATLKLTVVPVAHEWKSLGRGWFKDGFVGPLFSIETEEVEVEILQDTKDPSTYCILDPYQEWAEDFEYTPENARLVFCVKEDGTVYFKESPLGLYDPEYGYFYGLSLVRENGFGSFNYYGTWDAVKLRADFTQQSGTYLSYYGTYGSNKFGNMAVVLPGGTRN